MLQRARGRAVGEESLRVPVVDVEGLIGPKLQALVNQPSRVQDEADIRALLAAARGRLNVERLRDYYRLFDRERELERLLTDVAGR